MRVVSEPVQERASAIRNRIHNFLADDHCAQRGVAAGESFSGHKNIRSNTPMIDGKIPPGSPHARHHFIGDQQHAVTLANFRHSLHVARARNSGAKRSSTHGLQNECRRGAIGKLNRFFQLSRILFRAIFAPVNAVVDAAVAIRDSNMRKLPHQRKIHFTTAGIAGYRQRSQRRSVIALRAAQHVVALRLPDLDLILPRQLQRRFNRLRPAAREVNAAAAKMLPGKFQQFLGILFRDRRGELAAMHKLQLRGLLRHRR